MIPGTGEVRKLRWARPGSGKRSGARVGAGGLFLLPARPPALPAAGLCRGAGQRHDGR